MEACEVIINGDSWYIPCDRVNDIGLIGNQLIGLTSSSLTLYQDFANANDYSNYPRITCSWGSVCRLQQSSGNTYTYLTNATFEVKHRNLTDTYYTSLALFTICLGVILWKFLHK